MNLREQLLAEPSRFNTDMIVKAIDGNKIYLDELWALIKEDNYPVSWRAAWALEKAFFEYYDKCAYLKPLIIEYLTELNKDNYRRHFLKVIAETPLPDPIPGKLVDICFEWLFSAEREVAVRVHCMQILFNIAIKEPDLKQELKAALEELIPRNSAGFKARARKLLLELI